MIARGRDIRREAERAAAIVIAFMERESAVVTELVKVARLKEVVPGKGTAVMIADDAVALFNVCGHLFAIDGACVRCGASLASGSLHDTDLACPGCGWHYDIGTGCVCGLPALRIDTFEVSVVDSHVLLSIESRPAA